MNPSSSESSQRPQIYSSQPPSDTRLQSEPRRRKMLGPLAHATSSVPVISPSTFHFATDRPRLPPLDQLRLSSGSPGIVASDGGLGLTIPVGRPHASLSSPCGQAFPPPDSLVRPPDAEPNFLGRQLINTGIPPAFTNLVTSPATPSSPHYGVKRSFGEMMQVSGRLRSSPPIPMPMPLPPPVNLQDPRTQAQMSIAAGYPRSARSSFSDTNAPHGGQPHGTSITSMGYPPPSRTASIASSGSNAHRCTLHVRQQPRAARAGPDGKDRRPIDPPPVLQLLMNDFDPASERDMAEVKSHSWVVHAKLVSAYSPREDITTLPNTNEDGSKGEVTRLLLGTAVSSPFFCNDDPDIPSMPTHPTTAVSAPPSPSSRFLPTPSKKTSSGKGKAPDSRSLPSTFFIFADLSVRKAGEYRLEFRLMKMEPTNLVTGSSVPTIHSVTSQVFRVVNAKDFDQVQPSTSLVKGLLDRGAGFPLKLKKGTREGQRRRVQQGESDDDDDDDEGDD